MASSVFEGCAVDLSFAESEFKSTGNVISLHEIFVLVLCKTYPRVQLYMTFCVKSFVQ